MPPALLITLLVIAWGAFCLIAWWLWNASVREDRVSAGVIIRTMQLYTKKFHKLAVINQHLVPPRSAWHKSGLHNADPTGRDEPLIVVSNHVAGIDPIIIQASLPFEVRWMMAADMRIQPLEWLWTYARILFVDREGKGSSTALRNAMAHLNAGGCVGVFAEGYIERPPNHVLPFQDGVGLLVRRTGARVLLVAIDGIPEHPTAWASLWKPAQPRLQFIDCIDYKDPTTHKVSKKPADIAADLRQRLTIATNWPAANDQAPATLDA